MSTKEKIIERVNAIDNPEILDEILNLITAESNVSTIYSFSEDEKKSILKGVDDIKNGRVFDQKEADKMTKKWLEEN